MKAKILAGPRLDSMRFALLDEAAVLGSTWSILDKVRAGFFSLKGDGMGVPSTFLWAPDWNGDAAEPTDNFASWFTHKNRTGALDPWAFLEVADPQWVADVPRARLDLSRSGYLAAFNSPAGGPGYLAIKDMANPGSNVHPVQFDLASSWLWQFPDPMEAARKAVLWWAREGVLNGEIAPLLLEDFATHRVTRADVCVDHVLPDEEWTKDDLGRFAGRAKARGFTWLSPPRDRLNPDAEKMAERKTRRRELYSGPRSFTLYIGCRKATFLRIYDKIAQLGKDLEFAPCAEVWRRNGWNGVDRVWRAEVQICSKSLQYLNTNWGEPMRQLEALNPGQLWALYCESMRHVDLTASRLTRCPTSARWEAIAAAAGDNDAAHRSPIEAKEASQAASLRVLDRALKRCLIEGVGAFEVQEIVQNNYILPDLTWARGHAADLKSILGHSEDPKSLS